LKIWAILFLIFNAPPTKNIPLHKSGPKTDITNYRGIARLCAIPEFFESILVKYLNFNYTKIVSPYQHSFLSYRSTTTILLEFTRYVYESFSNDSQWDVIYTDLSKAFDKLNNNLLLIKLRMICFPENFLLCVVSQTDSRE